MLEKTETATTIDTQKMGLAVSRQIKMAQDRESTWRSHASLPAEITRCRELQSLSDECGNYVAERYDPRRFGKKSRVLGQGAYGIVYETTKQRAIKCSTAPSGTIEQSDLREAVILRNLIHPNIVRVEQVVLPTSVQQQGEQCRSSMIVLPLFPKSLLDMIRERLPMHNVQLRLQLIYQLLTGVAFMHSRNVLHRDLKPENCLVETDKADNSAKHSHLVIADFGQAQGVAVAGTRQETQVQSLWYRAPEISLLCERYDTAVDIWSVGIIWLEMLGYKQIFGAQNDAEQLSRTFALLGTKNALRWARSQPGWHKGLQLEPAVDTTTRSLQTRVATALSGKGVVPAPGELKLLEQMLQIVPSRRISALDALQSSLFQELDRKSRHNLPALSFSLRNGNAVSNCNPVLLEMELAPLVPTTESQNILQMISGAHPDLSAKVLSIVSHWLAQVTLSQDLTLHTLAAGMQTLTRFLLAAAKRENSVMISQQEIQGYAITALYVSAKLDSTNPFISDQNSAESAAEMSGNAYDLRTLAEMERTVLATLDLDLDRPSCVTFFEVFVRDERTDYNSADTKLRIETALASLIRSSMTLERLAHWRASQLAYACLKEAGFVSSCMKRFAALYPALFDGRVVDQILAVPLIAETDLETKFLDDLTKVALDDFQL